MIKEATERALNQGKEKILLAREKNEASEAAFQQVVEIVNRHQMLLARKSEAELGVQMLTEKLNGYAALNVAKQIAVNMTLNMRGLENISSMFAGHELIHNNSEAILREYKALTLVEAEKELAQFRNDNAETLRKYGVEV